MDKLDELILKHLPDTGLCERSKIKQAQRRVKLKVGILGLATYIQEEIFLRGGHGNPAYMKGLVTKEGGRLNAPDMAMIGGKEGHELAIDEMQFDQQEQKKVNMNLEEILRLTNTRK